jgi:hypothetical protein
VREFGGALRCASAQVAGERRSLPQGTERRTKRIHRPARNLARVGKLDAVTAMAKDHSSGEGTQSQSLVVELTASLGVRRVVELEPMVKEVTVYLVGANPTTHGIGCLEKDHVVACIDEGSRCHETSQPSTDHDDVGVRCSRGWHARERRGWMASVQGH